MKIWISICLVSVSAGTFSRETIYRKLGELWLTGSINDRMKTLNECVLASDSLMHTQTLTAKGLQYITKALYGDAHRPSMLAERLREEAVYRRKNQVRSGVANFILWDKVTCHLFLKVVVAETVWPTILNSWPFTEKTCWLQAVFKTQASQTTNGWCPFGWIRIDLVLPTPSI